MLQEFIQEKKKKRDRSKHFLELEFASSEGKKLKCSVTVF